MRIRGLSPSPRELQRLVHYAHYCIGADCWFQLLDPHDPHERWTSKAAEILTTERQPLLVIDDSSDCCLFQEGGRIFAAELLNLLDRWPRVPVVIFSVCQFGQRLAAEAQARRGHVLWFRGIHHSEEELATQISALWEGVFGESAKAVRLEYFSLGREPLSWLQRHPEEIQRLKPQAFEELLEDLFRVRGYNVRRTGRSNRADGGIDMILTPEDPASIPHIIAVQAKHRSTNSKIGSDLVRELAGAAAALPVNIAMLVSNTRFTNSAAWAAQRSRPLVQLINLDQLKEWIAGNFVAGADWAEIPRSIEVAPGHVVEVPMPSWLEH